MNATRNMTLPERSFARLHRLLSPITPRQQGAAALCVGEPLGVSPPEVLETIRAHADRFARYPAALGEDSCKHAVTDWLEQRYHVRIPTDAIFITSGSREILFMLAHLAVSVASHRKGRPLIAFPEPFYPTYLGGAIAAGADLQPLPCRADTGYLPDCSVLSAEQRDRLCALYVCSPGNPTGRIAEPAVLQEWLQLARSADAMLIADDCYSEVWYQHPPQGMLTCDTELDNVVIVNSLSKRSAVPGLRVGFCAVGARWQSALRTLRSYAGAQVPTPLQHAAAWLWQDEAHVRANRERLRHNWELACAHFSDWPGAVVPEGGLFYWLPVTNGEQAACTLYTQYGLQVLPGRYMTMAGADSTAPNVGDNYVRVAFVDQPERLQVAFSQILQTESIRPTPVSRDSQHA